MSVQYDDKLIDMKILLKLKHWEIFIVLICFNVLGLKGDIDIGFITPIDLSAIFSVSYIVLMFSIIINMGLNLNRISENPYRLNPTLLTISIIVCILGYSEMNISRLYIDSYSLPIAFNTIIVILMMFGLWYIFHTVPKSLKSMELGRESVFKEYVVYSLLLFALPIGIWVIQPKINKIFNSN